MFLSVCSRHGANLFIVDPGVLESWASHPAKHRSKAGWVVADAGIQQFCNRRMISFGVLATEWPLATHKWEMVSFRFSLFICVCLSTLCLSVYFVSVCLNLLCVCLFCVCFVFVSVILCVSFVCVLLCVCFMSD